MTIDEQFCATVQAISPVQEIGISHVGLAVFVIEPDRQQAIVIQCLSKDRDRELKQHVPRVRATNEQRRLRTNSHSLSVSERRRPIVSPIHS